MATLLAGIGSGISSALSTGGGVGGLLGQLVGGSVGGDAAKDLGGLTSLMPSGDQTGQAASQQQAQAPQTLGATNTNQYTPPTYNGISGQQSPFARFLAGLNAVG